MTATLTGEGKPSPALNAIFYLVLLADFLSFPGKRYVTGKWETCFVVWSRLTGIHATFQSTEILKFQTDTPVLNLEGAIKCLR